MEATKVNKLAAVQLRRQLDKKMFLPPEFAIKCANICRGAHFAIQAKNQQRRRR